MRVAVADDSALFRAALVGMLAAAGFEVPVVAATGDELVRAVAATDVDVVLLDIRMPPTHTDEGLQAAETIRAGAPDTGVLILSTFQDAHHAERVLRLGSHGMGYLLKDRVDSPDALGDALRRVAAGECVVDPSIIADLLDRQHRIRALDRLTERERAILALMAEGRSNAGISQLAGVQTKTVEKQVTSVFNKLGLPVEQHDNRRVLAVLTWLRNR